MQAGRRGRSILTECNIEVAFNACCIATKFQRALIVAKSPYYVETLRRLRGTGENARGIPALTLAKQESLRALLAVLFLTATLGGDDDFCGIFALHNYVYA
jgi:hypothetical protein